MKCSRLHPGICLFVTALVGSEGTAFGQSSAPVCYGTSTTYSATGAIQTFVVPTGVTAVTIDASGADGGLASDGASRTFGGRGARMVASFPVNPGSFSLLVGKTGGFGYAGGGGGATWVWGPSYWTPLLIAAGGGGASIHDSGGDGQVEAAQVGKGTGGGAAGTGGYGGAGGSPCPSGGGGGGFLGGGSACSGSSAGGKAFISGGAGGVSGIGSVGDGGYGGGGAAGGTLSGTTRLSGGGGGGSNGGGAGGENSGGGGGGSYIATAGKLIWSASGGNPGELGIEAGSVTFCYYLPPTVTGLAPTAGTAAGGQTVVISGTNLAGTTAVTFGGMAATLGAVTATSVAVTTPAHGVGAVDVAITTPGGTATATGAYTYLGAPTVTVLSPAAGPAAGGQPVMITGANMTGATAVTFGGMAATLGTATVTSVTVTTPAHVPGAVDVAVTTPYGTTTVAGAYTYVAAPTISSLTPTAGPLVGSQIVSINGSNLYSDAMTVTFGGTATPGGLKSPSFLKIGTPGHAAGAVDVVVTTPGGTATATGGYTYAPAPTVTGLAPTGGPVGGAQAVVISGTDLTGTTAVTFGGTAATLGAVTATSVTVTTPAHAAGAVDVAVTTPGGTATAAGAYTYIASTITSLSPTSGSAAGGQTVVLTGTNMTGATAVTFGGTAATLVGTATATSVTVTTPAHGVGAVDVAVTTPNGTATRTGGYTYVAAPAITSVAPMAGPVSGGQEVTIHGAGLTGTTAVTFGGAAATVSGVLPTYVMMKTPAHAAGVVDVAVTTPSGTATLAGGYTYAVDRVITGVVPTTGLVAGGQTVTISGWDLSSTTSVTFGGTAATPFYVSPTLVEVKAPSHAAGAVDVVVAGAGQQGSQGWTVTSASGFTYIAAPTVTGSTPSSGPATGGQTVVIGGTGLTGATAVTFGGAAATLGAVTATSVSVTTPVHVPGTVDLVVTTPGGTATLAGGYTYVAAPSIIGVAPPSGTLPGGKTVVIYGANLAGATAVTFGGMAATLGTTTMMSVEVTPPAHAAGAVDVAVTTPGGTATATNAYEFLPSPTISGMVPKAGPGSGGQTCVINGGGLKTVQSVKIGGRLAAVLGSTDTTCTTVAPSPISASRLPGASPSGKRTTPATVGDAVDVVVTTLGGTATLTGGYTYVATPSVTSLAPMAGPVAGGQTVVITGTNMTDTTAVTFDGTAATVGAATATSVTVKTPAHAAGAVDVAVTTPAGTATLAGNYTYDASSPTITSVLPGVGPTSGGQVVTINGTFLSTTTAVTFGAAAATSFTVLSGTSITATVPAHAAGAVDVVVTTASGAVTAPGGYTFTDSAAIPALSPGMLVALAALLAAFGASKLRN